MSDREPLDPELAGVVDEIADEGVPPWHAMSINAARRVEDELFSAGPTPAVGGVRDLGIEGPDGDDLPIRVYVPGSGDVGGDADDDETGPGTAGTACPHPMLRPVDPPAERRHAILFAVGDDRAVSQVGLLGRRLADVDGL